MGAPFSDERYSEYRKYAHKQPREQAPAHPDEQPYASSARTSRSSTDVDQGPSEFAPWVEPIRNRPPRRTESWGLIDRIIAVTTFAVLVAIFAIFVKPLWQSARAPLNPDSQALQASNPSDRNNALPENQPIAGTRNDQLSATTKIAAASAMAPTTSVQAQQASLAPASQPLGQETNSIKSSVRGVTDSEIRFGISAPFSGAAKELGRMKLGIETAFNVANASGGVHGRKLRLIAADDGYEPTRTAVTMKQLYEKDQVFGFVGNVGTPTAVVGLPYALERKMLFFGAFTGAGLLRSDPPDRYVFNYRASYAEETEAVVRYLVKVRRLLPEQIAVFAQQDPYGDSGFAGVAKAIRSLGGFSNTILRLNYQRNTVNVDEAVEQLKAEQLQRTHLPIRAVIMVPTYRAAAKFIEKTHNLYPGMIYTSVSFVGSTALAEELMLLGKKYATGVIVTQVVPAVDGHSSLVLNYKSALAKYSPGETPDYVSFEGYVAANVLIEALNRNGPQLDTETLVATLENLRDLDIGLGTPVSFSRSEHQGVHKVWGTQIDATGRYQAIDLQ
jgi:ABC-type branched-subunit amino acid transport system substrate-binding protein